MAARAALALMLSAAVAATLPVSAAPAPPVSSPAASSSSSSASAADLERVLSELDREERTLKKQLSELGAESDQAHARTLARGRTYVRLVRAGLLPLGGGFDEVVDHASRVERLRRALGRDLELEQKIAARRIQLAKRLGELRSQRGPLEVQQRALAAARNVLLAARDRELAFERAFSGASGHTAIYGAGTSSDPSDAVGGFAAMKGRLPFPLPGRTEILSARRAGTDGIGLEMRAPIGTPVRAVFRGRVAYADEYPAYGRTVILDHGDGYYTVSANLDEIAVEVGEEVSSGARIGSVGDTGGGALLYIEVRGGPDVLDPAEWFGI